MNLTDYCRKILKNEGIIGDSYKQSYVVPCPFHNETKGASLSISFDKGLFNCFSPQCEGKTKGTLRKLLRLLGYQTSQFNESSSPAISYKIDRIIREENHIDIPEFDLCNFQRLHNKNYKYLYDRGFTQEILLGNKISFSDYFQRIYIPVWQNGKCYGYSGRSVIPEGYKHKVIEYFAKKDNITYEEAKSSLSKGLYDNYNQNLKRWKMQNKYVNMYGLDKNVVVFEPLTNSSDRKIYIVCEGQLNALKCNLYGYNAFAIMGSYPTEVQVRYILDKIGNSILVLGFDNDKAGSKNTSTFRYIAKKQICSVDWGLLPDKNDIDELTKEQLDLIVSNRVYIT